MKQLQPSKWVHVTPGMATEWLSKNTHNRKISARMVARYASDMRAGEWKPNHQGIAFNCDGTLLDGQHRLAAVVEAGVPVWMMVTHGLDRDSQLVIDGGKSRSAADAMTLDGRLGTVSNKEVAVGRVMLDGPTRGKGAATTIQIYNFLEKHLSAIRFAESISGRNRRGVGAPMKAVIGRAYYTQDRDLLRGFASVITTGIAPRGTADNGPALLAKWANANAGGGQEGRRELYWKTERALIAYVQGEAIAKLYEETRERFPIPGEPAFDKSDEWKLPEAV